MQDRPKLLWGTAAVAKSLGVSKRTAAHLLEAGHVPARKVGKKWVAEEGRVLTAVLGPSE